MSTIRDRAREESIRRRKLMIERGEVDPALDRFDQGYVLGLSHGFFDGVVWAHEQLPGREEIARALADDWNPDRDPVLTAMFRDYAQTVLALIRGGQS